MYFKFVKVYAAPHQVGIELALAAVAERGLDIRGNGFVAADGHFISAHAPQHGLYHAFDVEAVGGGIFGALADFRVYHIGVPAVAR
jgi:hypothetical protein